MSNAENYEKPILLKSNFRQVQSVKVNFDRDWNTASLYMLLSNPKIHQYEKKQYFTISDFVNVFGNPVEFSEAGISAACVGSWIEIQEYMQILDEEPIQNKKSR